MRARTQILTLAEIIDNMNERNDQEWFRIMGVEIDGMEDALRRASSDDDDIADSGFAESLRLEREHVKSHGGDRYRVTWPQHINPPKARFDSDAWYQPVSDPE